MIPKTIHYCWFGRGKMSAKAVYCIESWKNYLPDYTLQLWNEDTFDINQARYVKQAYEAKKYAFVTDYVRLYALYHVGGIYMDTDVEVLKSLDPLLSLPGFSGFESDTEMPTGIMAAERHNPWAKEQLNYYADRPFLRDDNSIDYTTNVEIISRSMQADGFLLNNTYQVYKDCMHIFPKDYFCPKTRVGEIRLTQHTYCIHHFAGSWQPVRYKLKKFVVHRLLGVSITKLLVGAKRKLLNRIR